MKIKLSLAVVLVMLFLIPLRVGAARDLQTITDWYIVNFSSNMTVEADSSMIVTEEITADCGNLPEKHGIYRVLPTEVKKTSSEVIKTPIKLISITDFDGKPLKYSESKSYSDHTVTWKIGDPNKVVTGVNNYRIKYQVANVIRPTENFDEFYWNLNGNFWQIETDAFTANIEFPSGIDKSKVETNLYTGTFGSKNSDANLNWLSPNKLQVTSTKPLGIGEGITLSATFPKGIFSPYIPSAWEKYGRYIGFIIPFLALFICFYLWSKYGRDPKIIGPVVPEFDVPDKLTPMEIGEVISNGNLHSKYISAGIIDLAVKGYLKIKQIDKKEYQISKLKEAENELSAGEKKLLQKLFSGSKEIKLADLTNEFYKDIPAIETAVSAKLKDLKFVNSSGTCSQIAAIAIAIVFGFLAVASVNYELLWTLALAITIVISVVFIFVIPKRTVEAAKMLKKIDGFKLYMETAEKYRQRFNEKENIFERFLPYAMVFGITGLWIEKMKLIYGQEYYNTYHPVWFYGSSLGSFNANTFNDSISSLSSHMSSTLASSPSSSGSGGGGFSGGGGGGGGGGGW